MGKGEDWTCPSCYDLVFARNSNCRSCGAAKPGAASGGSGTRDIENTVYVRGLPFSATKDQLTKDFGAFGEVESFRLSVNDDGNHKGFCFIKYKDDAGVVAALKLDNTDYGG